MEGLQSMFLKLIQLSAKKEIQEYVKTIERENLLNICQQNTDQIRSILGDVYVKKSNHILAGQLSIFDDLL